MQECAALCLEHLPGASAQAPRVAEEALHCFCKLVCILVGCRQRASDGSGWRQCASNGSDWRFTTPVARSLGKHSRRPVRHV
jgi:hypothetical protein